MVHGHEAWQSVEALELLLTNDNDNHNDDYNLNDQPMIIIIIDNDNHDNHDKEKLGGTWPRSLAISGSIGAVIDQKGDSVQLLHIDQVKQMSNLKRIANVGQCHSSLSGQ